MADTKLMDLATRCEQATGPDRNLDAMIHARDGLEGVGYRQDAPAFTTSLDAAMTLVPEGWELVLKVRSGQWRAIVWPGNATVGHDGNAPAPALALCAAALRATINPEAGG